MTASRRRTTIATMVALGIVVALVWAATSGPTEVIGALPTGSPGQSTPAARPTPTAQPDPRQQPDAADDSRVAEPAGWPVEALGTILLLLGILVLVLLVHRLVRRLSAGLPTERLEVDLAAVSAPAEGREEVERAAPALRTSLAATEVRSAIVGCWVLLEQAAGLAGVGAEPAETSTEFVVRFLHSMDVDPRPVARLAELYREARFSSHPLGERQRAEARTALTAILREVERSPVP